MSVAQTVIDHLKNKTVDYQLIRHPHSSSSLGSAITAKVDPNQIAKGILVKKHDGAYLLAVLPASLDLDVKTLEDELGESITFAAEDELPTIFEDCELGAVPAIGPAYALETIVDTRLRTQPDIYFEAGDHEELVHIKESQFEKLLLDAQFLHISKEMM